MQWYIFVPLHLSTYMINSYSNNHSSERWCITIWHGSNKCIHSTKMEALKKVKCVLNSFAHGDMDVEYSRLNCEIALRKMQKNVNNKKSTLVEIMPGTIRQQATTWTNVDPDLCRQVASFGCIRLMYKQPRRSLFTKRGEVLPLKLLKSRNREIQIQTVPIAMKFGFTRLHEILRLDVLPLSE